MSNLTVKDVGLLTRQETANRLDISLFTLDRMVANGELKPIRRKRRWVRFRVADIDRYIQSLLEDED